MSETVEISREEYLDLYRASLEIDALEANGVDNWPGYEEVDWGLIDVKCERKLEELKSE